MRILALETSGMAGEIALLDNALIVASLELDPKQRTARTLVPGIAQILHEQGWRPADVQMVAVTIGPGSFTGLRIGVTTAKTFAYATRCQVLGINTLDVLAAQAPAAAHSRQTLWSVLDAQRAQLFAARYEYQPGAWRRGAEPTILDNAAFVAGLAPGDLVTGQGLKRLAGKLPDQVFVVEESLWQPRAATVGKLAWDDFQAGRRDDLLKLAPLYLRPSAAEEKTPS